MWKDGGLLIITLKFMILNGKKEVKDLIWDKTWISLDPIHLEKFINKFPWTFYSIADHTQRESLGIIVQYKVRVKLFMSPFGG